VYLPPAAPRPTERTRVGGIVDGGFARAKGIVETLYAALKVEPSFERAQEPALHPGKAARTGEGWVGELHPTRLAGTWGVFELDLQALLEHMPERIVYEDVITFPAVHQDLAFVVDVDVPAGDVFAAARDAAGPELRDVRFLSDYREPPIPEGKRSLAFSVSFQSPERTLTDEDAAGLRERIVAALRERFGAELRA
jgi:phenylalanyl-tRNA synthetase beta chain